MSDAEIQPPDETLVIQVEPPVVFNKGEYRELRLREPRGGEVRRAEGFMRNGANSESLRLYTLNLIATVSGWPLPAVETLRISTINEAAAYLNRFIYGGPETGAS